MNDLIEQYINARRSIINSLKEVSGPGSCYPINDDINLVDRTDCYWYFLDSEKEDVIYAYSAEDLTEESECYSIDICQAGTRQHYVVGNYVFVPESINNINVLNIFSLSKEVSLLVDDYGYKRISIGDIIRDFCYNAKYDVSIPKRTVEEAYLEVNLDGIGYIIDSLRLKDITVKGASDVNIAVPIKELVDRIGWEHAKRRFPQVRQLLVSTGNAIRSMVSDTYLVEKVLAGYDGYSDVVLSDVMYPAEVSYLLKNYRGCCIFIHGRDAAINYIGYDYDGLKRKEMSKIGTAK